MTFCVVSCGYLYLIVMGVNGCKTHVVVKSDIKVTVKADIALHGNPISELRDVTCHMGSHSVT